MVIRLIVMDGETIGTMAVGQVHLGVYIAGAEDGHVYIGLVCLELLIHALGECDRGMLGAEIRGSAVHGNEAGYGADVDYLAV